MPTFTIHAAKTNLSKLVARAEAGEEIVLARGKDPVVKIVPVTFPKPKRQFGAQGQVKIGRQNSSSRCPRKSSSTGTGSSVRDLRTLTHSFGGMAGHQRKA